MSITAPLRADARSALITSWVVLGFMVIQVLTSLSLQIDPSLASARRAVGITLAVGSALSFVHLQSLVLRKHRPMYFPWLRWGLIAIGILLLLTDAWAMLGMSLATLFLTSTRRQVLVLGPVLAIVVELALLSSGPQLVTLVGIPMYSFLAAGVIFVLTRLCVVLDELRLAREHIVRLQLSKERHRISRDLHDILGRTLVAASLRTQTARRLDCSDKAVCRIQLQQTAQTLSDGHAQLRGLVRGAVTRGLHSEIAIAVDLFKRVGVDCKVDADAVLTERDGQLAASVLREAVTNMLKHSRPRHTWISVREESTATLITIVNDGAPKTSPESGGTGLGELAQRVEQCGGILWAGQSEGSRYRVFARILHETAKPGAA